jgi:hypothetical protein
MQALLCTRSYIAILFSTLVLAGCVSHKIPSNATLSDSGLHDNSPKAQLFVVEKINGDSIYNSSTEGRYVSQGDEITLHTPILERIIPIKPLKVQISGRCITGAPLYSIRNQRVGSFFEIRGTVDFIPRANGHYIVKGDLNRDISFLWIEDLETHQAVTEKIIMTGRQIFRS